MMQTSGRAVRKSVLRTHQEIVLRAAEEIGLFLGAPIHTLRLAVHMVGETWDDPWKAQTALIQVCLEAPVLERVYFLDTEGREIASSDMRSIPMPPEGRQAFEEAMRTKALYRSGVIIPEEAEAPSMMLGAPVLHRGRPVGALVALVNLRDMWALVDRIRVGERSIAYVVSEEGVFLAHTDKKNVLNEARLPEERFETMRSDPRGNIDLRDESGGWLVLPGRNNFPYTLRGLPV